MKGGPEPLAHGVETAHRHAFTETEFPGRKAEGIPRQIIEQDRIADEEGHFPRTFFVDDRAHNVVGGRKQRPEDMFKRTIDNKWGPNCDVFHLGDGGEYFQALVWAASLFDGIDLTELEYRPPFVTEDEAKLMREIAMGLN